MSFRGDAETDPLLLENSGGRGKDRECMPNVSEKMRAKKFKRRGKHSKVERMADLLMLPRLAKCRFQQKSVN